STSTPTLILPNLMDVYTGSERQPPAETHALLFNASRSPLEHRAPFATMIQPHTPPPQPNENKDYLETKLPQIKLLSS
ncbi:hypothetical protein FRC08_010766, partial [Ceratobasidium sp. 394]